MQNKLFLKAADICELLEVKQTSAYEIIGNLNKELNSIVNKTEEVEAENVELQRILEDDDMNAYMKKLAIEDMNYAYPDERRYYDTSRN